MILHQQNNLNKTITLIKKIRTDLNLKILQEELLEETDLEATIVILQREDLTEAQKIIQEINFFEVRRNLLVLHLAQYFKLTY